MTVERLLVVEPTDLLGLRVTCQKCRATLSYQLDESVRLPERCPSCGAEWVDNFKGADVPDSFKRLVEGLKTWIRAERELKPHFRVTFELKDPDHRPAKS